MTGGLHLPPEAALCVEACRVDRRPSREPAHINPGLLLRLAAWHRVAAFMWENAGPLALPDETRLPLRNAAMATLHRNMQMLAETRRALGTLSAEGVEVILLKGIHLLDAVYDHPGQRPVSDVDLMVLPEKAMVALEALQRTGYEAEDASLRGLRRDGELRLSLHGVHSMTVEVHTTLSRRTRHRWFESRSLWERSVPYTLDGVEARALSWPDTLVYLCAHAVPHAFSQVIWLRDIAAVARRVREEGGWQNVVAAADEFRARRATAAGLRLASLLLGAEVPDGVPADLCGKSRPASVPWVAALIGRGRYSTLASLCYRVWLADSARDAALQLTGAFAARLAGPARERRQTQGGA